MDKFTDQHLRRIPRTSDLKGPRIVLFPVTTTLGGKVLSFREMDLAALMIDPVDFGPERIIEALDYVSPDCLVDSIVEASKSSSAWSHLGKTLFDDEKGRLFFQELSSIFCGPAMHSQSPEGVIPRPDELLSNYVSSAVETARQDAERLHDIILANNRSAIPANKRVMASIAHASPEIVQKIFADYRGSTMLPGMPNYEKTLESAKKGRAKYVALIEEAIAELPIAFRDAIRKEHMTIAVPQIVVGDGHPTTAISNYNRRLICLEALSGEKASALKLATKEELIHYLDQKFKISQSPEFQATAKKLLADPAKMDEIEKRATKVHSGKKLSIRGYGESQRPIELLADYYHIRDDNYILQNDTAIRHGFSSGPAFISLEIEDHVPKIMQKMFGHEFCKLCDEFEKTVAKSLTHGRAIV